MKIYFDETLVDGDYIADITKSAVMFDRSFRLGASACRNYTIKVSSSAITGPIDVITIYQTENNQDILKDTLRVIKIEDVDNNISIIYAEDSMTLFNFRYNIKERFPNQSTYNTGDVFDDILSLVGISVRPGLIVNIRRNIDFYDNGTKYLARDYLQMIGEVSCLGFFISPDNELVFRDLSTITTPNTLATDFSAYKIGTRHEITRVVFDGDNSWSYGDTTGETYYIDSNNTCIQQASDVQSIYNKIKNKVYYDIQIKDVELITDLYLGLTYKITIDNVDYPFIYQYQDANYYQSEDTGKWLGNVNINLENEAQQETEIIGTENKLIEVKRIVDYDSGRIDQIIEETPIISTEQNGIGSISLQNLLGNRIIELKVHPTDTDIIGLVAKVGLKVSTNLKIKSRRIYFTGDETYNYNIGNNLYCLDGVYDEYIYDGSNKKVQIIHRIGINQGTKYVLETPTTEELPFFEMIIGSGDNVVSMPSHPTAYIYARTMIQNDFTQNFATDLQLKTDIEQTSRNIAILAQEKIGEEEIIAKINTAVENGQGIIELKGNCVTIDSDNCTLTSDGHLTVREGTFKGNLNTDYDCKVGNNIYVGQNNTITTDNRIDKGIFFGDNAEITHLYYNYPKDEIIIHSNGRIVLINDATISNNQYTWSKMVDIEENDLFTNKNLSVGALGSPANLSVIGNSYLQDTDVSGDLTVSGDLQVTNSSNNFIKELMSQSIMVDKDNSNVYLWVGNTIFQKVHELRTRNSSIDVGIGADASGKFRIWDYTNSKDVLRDSGGTMTFNGNANTATKATQDEDGNVIKDTYAKLTDIYYYNNNTYSATQTSTSYSGFITTSGKSIRFTVPLPKNMNKINGVTINNLTMSVRGVGGNYVPAQDTDFLTNTNKSSINTYRIANNLLVIVINGTNAWTNATNNTPVAVAPVNFKVTFTSS